MNKTELRRVVLDQHERRLPESPIERDSSAEIQSALRREQIVIISGIRRCGKSTLLAMIRAKQEQSDYYLNFDDERLIDFSVKDFQALTEVFLELYGEQGHFYFDEIQNVDSWERFIRRLHDEGKKILITGSNASMLSRELGTHLTGRYVEKQLYPFSFAEFLRWKGVQYDVGLAFTTKARVEIKKAFDEYIRLGGFPEYFKNENPDRLKSLYESILYRDIVVRHKIPNAKPIKELVHFCASNIGKEISFHSLKNVIGIKSPTSVKEYFEYLENSYLVFLLIRFDFSLKSQLYYNKKNYFIDSALARNIGFRFSDDDGRILENLVFLELKRRNKEIFFHKKECECDFLVKEGNKVVEAIQVCKNLENEKTIKREIAGLCEALNEHHLKTGLLLTEDEEGEEISDSCKITIKPVYKWLLESGKSVF